MARPGVMLYFDILEPIRVLSDSERGQLLVAILEYGQYGTVPRFDGLLALAWGFIKPKLDKDEETYESSVVQRKYAAFCKRRAALNLPKVLFEEWINLTDSERERLLSTDNEPLRAVTPVASRYPTTTTSSTSNTSTTITTAAAATTNTNADGECAAAAAYTDRIVNMFGGTLGKDVIFLSNAQIEDLLDKMGVEAFDYYTDKLSTFIIRNDAKVKNHYQTILKWWEEDGRTV